MVVSYLKLLFKIVGAYVHLDHQTVFSNVMLKAVYCPPNLQALFSRPAT